MDNVMSKRLHVRFLMKAKKLSVSFTLAFSDRF